MGWGADKPSNCSGRDGDKNKPPHGLPTPTGTAGGLGWGGSEPSPLGLGGDGRVWLRQKWTVPGQEEEVMVGSAPWGWAWLVSRYRPVKSVIFHLLGHSLNGQD